MKLKKLLPLASVVAIASIVPAVTSCTLHFNPGEEEEEEWVFDPTNPTAPEIYTEKISEGPGLSDPTAGLTEYANLSNVEKNLPEDLLNYAYHSAINKVSNIGAFKMTVEADKPDIKKQAAFTYSQKIEMLQTKQETYISISFKNLIFGFSKNVTTPWARNEFNPIIILDAKNIDVQEKEYQGQWLLDIKVVIEGEEPVSEIKCTNAKEFAAQQAGIAKVKALIKSMLGEAWDSFSLAPAYLSNVAYK